MPIKWNPWLPTALNKGTLLWAILSNKNPQDTHKQNITLYHSYPARDLLVVYIHCNESSVEIVGLPGRWSAVSTWLVDQHQLDTYSGFCEIWQWILRETPWPSASVGSIVMDFNRIICSSGSWRFPMTGQPKSSKSLGPPNHPCHWTIRISTRIDGAMLTWGSPSGRKPRSSLFGMMNPWLFFSFKASTTQAQGRETSLMSGYL